MKNMKQRNEKSLPHDNLPNFTIKVLDSHKFCCHKIIFNVLKNIFEMLWKLQQKTCSACEKNTAGKFRPFHVWSHNKKQRTKRSRKIFQVFNKLFFALNCEKCRSRWEMGGERKKRIKMNPNMSQKKARKSVKWKIMKFMKQCLLFEVLWFESPWDWIKFKFNVFRPFFIRNGFRVTDFLCLLRKLYSFISRSTFANEKLNKHKVDGVLMVANFILIPL